MDNENWKLVLVVMGTWLGGEELVIGIREDDKWKRETLVQLS
jgi:hypothetical protein